MADRRALALASARVTGGVVSIAAIAVFTAAAVLVPLPSVSATASGRAVTPVAADQTRVCAGGLLELGADSQAATQLTSIGTPDLVTGTDAEAGVDSVALTAPDDSAGGEGPTAVSVSATDAVTAPLVAAATSQEADRENLAGFASAGCVVAGRDTWIVAGSTDVGRTSLVILENATAVDALVDLDVQGEEGVVDAPAGHDIVVPAGTQKVVDLAGLAPNVPVTAVHVTSTGGDVAAWIQQSSVRGLTPSGVEIAGAGAAASSTQTIAGVRIGADQPEGSSDTYDDRAASVRIAATTDEPTHAEITVTDADGEVVQTTVVDVPALSTGEYPLGELDAGVYSIGVEATSPVAASARTAVQDDDVADFSWFASGETLTGDNLVAVATGPAPRLSLYNPADADTTVTVGSEDVVVEAGTTLTLTLKGGATLPLAAGDGVVATVSYAGGSGVSATAVTPPAAASEPIEVYVR